MVNEQPPLSSVFLHSGFRSGSTWFWSKFRQSESSHSYYEPFNEVLAELQADEIVNNKSDAWASGHPKLEQPYYEEFRSLIRLEGGVSGFHPDMPYALYYNGAAHQPQQDYIEGLARHAREAGKIPVFGFCRSYARVPWLRRYCGGRHIVTLRNPKDQWASYRTQHEKHDNAYFHFKTYMIATIGWHGKVYSGFFDGLPFTDLLQVAASERAETLYAYFLTLGAAERCRVFLRVFALDMLVALPQADVVVDLDELSANPAYRGDVTTHLRALTGLADLSFEDCALPHSEAEDSAWTMAVKQELHFLDRFFLTHQPGTGASRVIAIVKAMLRGETFAIAERHQREPDRAAARVARRG